jgi:hypothetical protein
MKGYPEFRVFINPMNELRAEQYSLTLSEAWRSHSFILICNALTPSTETRVAVSRNTICWHFG